MFQGHEEGLFNLYQYRFLHRLSLQDELYHTFERNSFITPWLIYNRSADQL